MKRTLMFSLLILAVALIGGCSSASAQCAGGRCASVGFYTPWIGAYYYTSPCAGGRCAAKKAEPGGEAPAGDKGSQPLAGVGEIGSQPSAVASAGATAKPGAENCPPRLAVADTAPELVEFRPFCLRVAELVNAHRKALGLPALELDESLCSGCDRHSAWMASGGGLTHAYYGGGRECIAQGVRSPEAVVNLWLGSSGHRAIILGTGRTLGVGCSGSFWTLRVR